LRRSKVYSLSGLTTDGCNRNHSLMIAACFQNFDLAETRGLNAEISSRWFGKMPDANNSNSNFFVKGKRDEEVRKWYEASNKPACILDNRNGGSGSRNDGCVSVAGYLGGF
jgi:hypothetical protein